MAGKKSTRDNVPGKKSDASVAKPRAIPGAQTKTDPARAEQDVARGAEGSIEQPESGQHLILSFKALSDPSPDKMAEVVAAVESLGTARIVRARPGMLKINVPIGDSERVRLMLRTLQEWDICEEALASMPTGKPPHSSST